MGQPATKTVHVDARLYRALRSRAAKTGETISSVVSRAVTQSLVEDGIDIRAIEDRKNEPSRPLDEVLQDLRRGGCL